MPTMRETLKAAADDFDAISKALTMKPGDTIGDVVLLRKDVENGVFGWRVSGGGFISLNNLIAEVRIARNGARFPAALRALQCGALFQQTATATIQTAVGLVHRHEHEKEALRPRLDILEQRLCQSRGFILGVLDEAGLTLVLLKDTK